jgi:hypothetical protein
MSEPNVKEQHYCIGCNRVFKSSRAINSHWQQNQDCSDACNRRLEHSARSIVSTNEDTSSINFEVTHSNEDSKSETSTNINELNEQEALQKDDVYIFNRPNYHTGNSLPAKIELLKLLNTAKAPLYLFDHIMTWAKNAVNKYDVDFGMENNLSREKFVQELKMQYNLENIDPIVQTVTLRGSGNTTEIITHSFKASLYTLLNDTKLMTSNNLLITEQDIHMLVSEENITTINASKSYGDVNTGSVYIKAKKDYLQTSGDMLCPIIFFIDKTHTDINGRLCLEPIRFTLGIFNRETRNNPLAWRTIGYISDQAQMKKTTPSQKATDYHHIIEIILQEFIQCQLTPLPYKLFLNNKYYDVNLKIPVLFLIGDTEGLDKICGRYTSRNNIQRPCRCCDCPFLELDNPEFKYKLNNHSKIVKHVQTKNKDELKALSMHKLSNAWAKVQFCDTERGLFGAVCGDIMHCLQHGLFIYLITILFDQKKFKDANQNASFNEAADILSSRSAFPEAYCSYFDSICRKYGKRMMHQSDRSLPRTHFYSNYTSVTRKNASEMSGILLVYLMVFNSSEGESNIDDQLGAGRTAKFIHLFELMLMLENFCNQEELSHSMVRTLHHFMPYLLNTYKFTLDRQVGCQMKIIKFHLPVHFASDIQRFGSMKNFDTGIGESHHKTEAKLPAKNTQRRKSNFELQTAKRQTENIAINIAYNNFCNVREMNQTTRDADYEECKWYRYIFDCAKGDIYQNNQKSNQMRCFWKDKNFQKQLHKVCTELVEKKCIEGCHRFFTQHNRGQFIFRADPSYESNEPWYDWASIKWEGDGIIPAKLMLFWDISYDKFLKPFQIGCTTVSGPGTYALSYSLASTTAAIKAHGASHLVKYAKIDFEKDLCIIPVDSIHSPITALPYKVEEDIIVATEWILLVSKSAWKQIFFDFMKMELSTRKNKNNNKRKRGSI